MGRPKPPGHMGIGEGGAQPLSGLVFTLPSAHEAPQHLSGLPKHLSVMLVITRYLRNTSGLQNPSSNISIFTSRPLQNSL